MDHDRDHDEGSFKTVSEVLEFKADLAALAAAHCRGQLGDHADVLVSFLEFASEPPRYGFERVFHDPGVRPEHLLPKAAKAFYLSLALICRYRPGCPEPDGMDLVRLGLILSGAKVRGKSLDRDVLHPLSDFRVIEILDYGIVDENRTWRSVFDVTGLSKWTWCTACMKHVYSSCGEINPRPKTEDDWEWAREDHRRGCLYAASEGLV